MMKQGKKPVEPIAYCFRCGKALFHPPEVAMTFSGGWYRWDDRARGEVEFHLCGTKLPDGTYDGCLGSVDRYIKEGKEGAVKRQPTFFLSDALPPEEPPTP